MLKPGWLGMVCGALLAGCAESPPPTAQVQSTSQAIGAAEGARARSVPSAAYHLALAREQSAQAQRLLADGYMQRANMLLLRAEADARLAYSLARQADQRNAAQHALDRVHALQGSAR